MANEQAEQELGKLLQQVVTGQLRTIGMFMTKINTRIDGDFKIKTPKGNENKQVFYTLQTKTVTEGSGNIITGVDAQDESELQAEKEVLEQIVRDLEYREALLNENYEELPPEFNPEKENKSKEEMIEFLNGRWDGLLEAYEQATGEMFSKKLDKPKYADMDGAMGGERQSLPIAKNRLEEINNDLS